MNRQAMGRFLRQRREALTPAEAGLPASGRRRTPGLRREEVAGLAHVSTDHYTRLEQARGSAPSRHVLRSVARALRLDDTEREHLFALADGWERLPGSPAADVPGHVRELIARMPLTAALVRDSRSDVLAWNPLARVVLAGFFGSFPQEHNLLRRYFLHPDPTVRYLSSRDESAFAQQAVAALRRTADRFPRDDRTRRLVAELHEGSEAFRRLWARPAHPGGRTGVKTVLHPSAGTLTLNYDVLDIPDHDHQILLFTAEPGSPTAANLHSLAA
ncbi:MULTISPECIES: helix-turn-helix transcriptional regulator [Actinoplanes]|uniref:helix-turn-helix transcriptional regulator n=1 Tax=Actinoplanes TaxID=1865 RepID=UPI0005F2E1FA|nr:MULTISPECIES: helix-turn-helix transcriptional regulator [Actinoplanes]